MRIKRSQLSAKDHVAVLKVLEFLFCACYLCPIPFRWRNLAVAKLQFAIDILKGAESVKDPENSGTPTGKTIKPAKPRERGKRKVGGQEGHQGHTHELDPNPTEVINLTPSVDLT